jgi:AraC-like DNA-binding protein
MCRRRAPALARRANLLARRATRYRRPVASVPSVPAGSATKVIDHAARLGVARDVLLAAAGVALPAEAGARIPFRALARLYEVGARLTRDDAFGLHVGEASHPSMFDALGEAAIRSPTLGAAFDRVLRYYRVVQEGGRVAVVRAGDAARISYAITDPGAGPCRHEVEATLAILLRFLDVALGRPVVPRAVWLAHRAPRRTGEHRRVLRVAPRFAAPEHRIELPAALLDAPLPRADAGLERVLDRLLEHLLRELPRDDSVATRVRERVAATLRRGPPDVGRVARELGLSARTLQRKLAEEATSFRAVVDDVRRDLARRYVAESDASPGEIAAALGYADAPTFHRAFRRWTGETPRTVRRGSGPP